jgi:hypothetical protein
MELRAYYRRRASELRKLADAADNSAARDHVIRMSKDYLAKAKDVTHDQRRQVKPAA